MKTRTPEPPSIGKDYHATRAIVTAIAERKAREVVSTRRRNYLLRITGIKKLLQKCKLIVDGGISLN